MDFKCGSNLYRIATHCPVFRSVTRGGGELSSTSECDQGLSGDVRWVGAALCGRGGLASLGCANAKWSNLWYVCKEVCGWLGLGGPFLYLASDNWAGCVLANVNFGCLPPHVLPAGFTVVVTGEDKVRSVFPLPCMHCYL